MEFVVRKIQEKIHRSLNSCRNARYFSNVHNTESAELLKDLTSTELGRQKDAVKHIIAKMTVGGDVSNHFVNIIKLSQTEDLELKKLVYLYVLNTAKLQPDKAILAVNTFLQDVNNPSPIVRALAVRTMLCIRVPAVLDYLIEPLHCAVGDPDPYVRKTAAIGIGKLFHHNMNTFYDHGFADELLRLLFDSNPIVASNAAAIVAEVNSYAKTTLRESAEWSNRILINLPEATEWGQVYLLDLLSTLSPSDAESAESVVARVVPRLNHTNPAVAMGAIKVIANVVNCCSTQTIERVTARINAALLTLAGASDPETQYIVYKNIHALMVLFPNILRNNLDVFYVRFNDRSYIKLEKLRLLLRLVTPSTAPGMLSELTEYTTEVDIVFLEEVVSVIALLAIKVESVSISCAELLMKVLQTRCELLPCIVIAAKNIMQKYPNLLLLEPLITEYGPDAIIGEEAKASFVWMLGEHCDFVEHGQRILNQYMTSIMLHEPSVQLSILRAAVKAFLRDRAVMQPKLSELLETISTQSDDPDICDCAMVYWRLLSKDAGIETIKAIMLDQNFALNVDHTFSDAMMMADLKRSINTAAVVFGQPFRSFVPPYGLTSEDGIGEDEQDEDGYTTEATGENRYTTFPTAQSERAVKLESQSEEKDEPVLGKPMRNTSSAHRDPLDMLFQDAFGGTSSVASGQVTKHESPTGVETEDKNKTTTVDELFS